MKRNSFGLVFTLIAAIASAQTPPPPIVSPEVQPDHRVTFRFRAPNAKEVSVAIEGVEKPLRMEQDARGFWTVTTDPLAHHFYKSGVVGDDRGYFVYTPPGYDPRGKQTYPVLYLLHGYSDNAEAWTAVGRANIILDNLIAQGKAKPMLIVMPLGYGAPEILSRTGPSWRDRSLVERNFSKFREALLTEVMPRIEKMYRVSKDRNSHAIAGLSMGGSESLLTGLNTIDRFAWIGAFSSGGMSEDFNAAFPALGSNANEQLRLLWIACGTEDRLIEINRKFREWLKSKDIRHSDIETPGAH